MKAINLIADGDIPTTAIVAQALARICDKGDMRIGFADAIDRGSLCEQVTVFSRVLDPSLAWLPEFMTRHGARYAYFLDDNFWECDVSPELTAYYDDAARRAALNEFVGHAAAVIVNSAFLGERVNARFPHAHVIVIPPHFDFSLVASDARVHIDDSPLRVGFAGTTRGEAFDAVVDAIRRLLREYAGKVEFECIGFIPQALQGVDGVAYFPVIARYDEFLAFNQARRWDVGLAPLATSVFARSKTNNKFREYGALRIAGLYSDVEPYRGSVTDGVNGILVAEGADAWYSAIARLILDRSAVRAMGDSAYSTVLAAHDLSAVSVMWKNALCEAKLTPLTGGVWTAAAWKFHLLFARQRIRVREYVTIVRARGLGALFVHIVSRFRHMSVWGHR